MPFHHPDYHQLAEAILARRQIPRATYRLQLHAGFTLKDALQVIPYLMRLGVSHVYASPILMPRKGSTHGYDVADHGQLNPDLGTDADFAAFTAALNERGMSLILDIVPNHMGIFDTRNQWWMDVLENGQASFYAHYFDIDWMPQKPELHNRVLLPVLGDLYGNVLERGELRLHYADGAFAINYHEHTFPLEPRTYEQILRLVLEQLSATSGEDDPHVQELLSILTAISYLPEATALSPDKMTERSREKEVIKRRLDLLCQDSPTVQATLAQVLVRLNGENGEADGFSLERFDLLDALLAAQPYRLAFWRVSAEEINYRRFFDINDLAAIRVEDPQVFTATHDLTFAWLSNQQASGLRIDHPDGLWNPPHYFRQLQITYLTRCILAELASQHSQLPDDLEQKVQAAMSEWLLQHLERYGTHARLPLYVVAEKILSENEPLPQDWTVHGTTGYDFLNEVLGILIDQQSERAFDRLYQQFTEQQHNFANLVNRTKKQIMNVALASEIYELSYQLERIAETHRRYRDFTLNTLTLALREVIACLSVYRTYVTEDGVMQARDQAFVRDAVQEARQRNPIIADALFDFLETALTLQNLHEFRPDVQPRLIHLVMKFQQITSPVMAKGLEDTAFYLYNRLAALNEVGGHPEHFGTAVATFHRRNAARAENWRHSMLTLSTHDTKRSEDVRARLAVLSELPEQWRTVINRWARMNVAHKQQRHGQALPDRNDEYLLYQTLVGTWDQEQPGTPAFAEYRTRIANYMEKATREAKLHTSWVNPNAAYDNAMRHFVEAILDDRQRNRFLIDLDRFRQKVAFYGKLNSLTQKLLLLTVPGVPDIYQGTELWDFSLVDPDNRRPVDFVRREVILAQLATYAEHAGEQLLPLAREVLDDWQDGRVKLFLVAKLLQLRQAQPDLFRYGGYTPLYAEGPHAAHVVAFQRHHTATHITVVAPRLIVSLTDAPEHPVLPLGERVWGDTLLRLPQGQDYPLTNLFTGEQISPNAAGELSLARVLRHFPVAVLVMDGASMRS